MQQHPRTGYILSVTAAFVWALTGPGIKYLLDVYQVPELVLAFWRDAFIAAACVGGLALWRPALLRVRWSQLRGFALIGTISIGLYHALFVLSIALNGAAVAIVLIYTFPVFVTLGAWLFFREPIRPLQIAALVLALVGCALLVRFYDPAVLRFSWVGALVGVVTGITHAGYVLFSQRAVQSVSPWTSLTYTMLFGALTLLVLALVGGQFLPPSPQMPATPYLLQVGSSWLPWLVLLSLALGPTLGGYALFTASLQHISAKVSSLIVILEAPVAALIAVLLLGERLEWPQVLGIVLILGAILLPRLLSQFAPAPLPQQAQASEVV